MASSSFTPIFDFMLSAYKDGTSIKGRGASPHAIAIVFGVIYRYTRMSKADPRCVVGAKRIASRSFLDETTTRRCIRVLIGDGWICLKQESGKTPVIHMTDKAKAMLGQEIKRTSNKQVVYDE